MSGRRPKPTALRVLQGNPGHRAINKLEPKPSGVPTCPKHLSKVARAEWKRVSRELIALGLLTSIDRAALAAYCAAYARWADAEENIAKFGAVIKTKSGNAIQSPFIGIANRAMELMHKFCTEFGLTPSSRTRLQVSPQTQTPSDIWDELLSEIPASVMPDSAPAEA